MRPTDEHIPLRWPTAIMVGALTLVGLFVRAWGLWDYAPTPDEALVLGISSKSTILGLLSESLHHPHPPLRYFLLHFMLYISDDLFFLRTIAVMPGAAMIPAFFVLGRRTAGTASGIAMAMLAAFGHAGMMLSEILRTYVLGALFVTVGLAAFCAYVRDHRSKHLVFYSGAMALGLLSHYSTVLPLAAICVVWASLVVRSGKKLQMGLTALAANLPAAAVALTTYWFHLSSRNPSRWWQTLHQGPMGSEYPETLAGFVINTLRLFHYLFLPQHAWWLLILFGIGLVVLWMTGRRVIWWVILLTFCLNAGLTLAHKYPFGGVRQSFFLFPLIALSIGAVVQVGWEHAESLLGGMKNTRVFRWATSHRGALGLVTVVLFSLGLGVAAVEISQAHFLRHRFGPGKGELPVMRNDVAEALSFLNAHVRAGDVILAERQTMLFAEVTTGSVPSRVTDAIARIGFEGFDLYHVHLDYGFFLDTKKRIDASVERLLRHVEAPDQSKIWIVSIGWQRIRDAIGQEICGPPMTDAWSQGGAAVYGFRASAFVDAVSGDPVDAPRSGTAGNQTPR